VVRRQLRRRPTRPAAEGEDPCPDTQDVAAGPQVRADQAQPDHARLGQLFKHAVAKHTFSKLAYFAWWRVIRMLRTRHRWRWKDVRRRLTTPTGAWLWPAADGVELFNMQTVPIVRYPYRGNKIPNPWAPPSHA
jgi:RNA-directed DNA polymerase